MREPFGVTRELMLSTSLRCPSFKCTSTDRRLYVHNNLIQHRPQLNPKIVADDTRLPTEHVGYSIQYAV
jgi:hypothetical protein